MIFMTEIPTVVPEADSAVDPESLPGNDVAVALAALRRTVGEVLRAAPATPGRVSVRIGSASIEVEWPVPAAGPGGEPLSGTPVPAARPETGGHLMSPVPVPVLSGWTPAVPVEQVPSNGAATNHYVLTSPMVGTFYCSQEPGAPPLVKVGDVLRPGQQVAIIEAMKLLSPVETDRAGRVVDIHVGNTDPVEYGQPLLTLDLLDTGDGQ